ncbi:HNH endonuclease signature motif containing protein [Noviherbaspirillum aridicola]|uniref:Endonuclease n=1 Tax=Noviherbaspirillum aridicola TaxID=2849687 RepID=A0ABQ4Q3G9_9BURK|nr:HNH endonuclease signature motif containing protein [Noviherbaspirillum aridicola]GIZ51736.1 endonuclease [Noviherbaspirillum aridicola]
MTAANPIPFSVEELESIFALDREKGRLVRTRPGQGRKNRDNFRADYRYVSINGVQYFEHRLIWMLTNRQHIPPDMDVDHINRNKRDNRPENLRLATTAQNRANIGKQRNNSTGYKGVFLDKGKFRAKIKTNGTQRFLGSYGTAEAAAAAYDSAALAAFGEFAMTNAQMGLLAA